MVKFLSLKDMQKIKTQPMPEGFVFPPIFCIICNKMCPAEGRWRASARVGGWYHAYHTNGELELYIQDLERKGDLVRLMRGRQ